MGKRKAVEFGTLEIGAYFKSSVGVVTFRKTSEFGALAPAASRESKFSSVEKVVVVDGRTFRGVAFEPICGSVEPKKSFDRSDSTDWD